MSQTTTSRTILLFGHDDKLLESRALLLAAYGEVVISRDVASLTRSSPERSDLIVLCHTLSAEELMLAASIIADRKLPIEVLAVTLGGPGSREAHWTNIVNAFEGPRAFLAKVEALLHRS